MFWRFLCLGALALGMAMAGVQLQHQHRPLLRPATTMSVSSPRDSARRNLAAASATFATMAVLAGGRRADAKSASSLLGLGSSLSTTAAAPALVRSSVPSAQSPPSPPRPVPLSPSLPTPPPPTFVNGLISGAASRASKELLLHPIETLKARLQVPSYNSSTRFDNLYDGVAASLIGGIPAGALFFATKDYSKSLLGPGAGGLGFSKEAATLLSVSLANVPYWLVRTPWEVLKTQQQVSQLGSGDLFLSATNSRAFAMQFLRENGDWSGVYSSFSSNIAYSLPADVVKFIAYEALTSRVLHKAPGQKIEGLEGACVGALAGLVSTIVTTPLDVVRTRVMTDTLASTTTSSSSSTSSSSAPAHSSSSFPVQTNPLVRMSEIIAQEGLPAVWTGLGPRAVRAIGSGAIQFGSYEITQNFLLVK